MRKQHLLFAIFFAGLIAGCAATPQTAEEFRQFAAASRFVSIETFEVERSHADVSAIIKEKTEECLDDKKVIRTTCVRQGPTRSCSDQTRIYNPTVIPGKDKTEFYLQIEQDKTVYTGGQPPEGGAFMVVADFYPVDRQRTNVTLYSPTTAFTITPKAIKHWAQGTNLGCPDLSMD